MREGGVERAEKRTRCEEEKIGGKTVEKEEEEKEKGGGEIREDVKKYDLFMFLQKKMHFKPVF
jgi:hypothetical protein